MAENYAVSKQLLQAIESIEAIPEADRRPAEKEALKGMLARKDSAMNEVGATGATYRGFAQGATFNLADELRAALLAMSSGSEYGTELEKYRGRDRSAQASYPSEFNKGEFVGIGASSMIPFGIAGKAKQGLGVMKNAARMAVAGGSTAAMQTFGRGEGGFIPRVKQSLLPTAIGAVTGGGASLLARGGGNLARYATGGGDNIAGLSPRAASKMVGATRRHAASGGEDIQQYLSRLGPEGTLADVPGAMQTRAVGLAGMPGEGGDLVNRTLNARARQGGERMQRITTDVLGDPLDAAAARAGTTAARRDVGSPLYRAALSYEPRIDVTDVSNSFKSLVANSGPDTGAVLSRFSKPLSGSKGMTAAKLHAIRSDLSDAAAVARRAGNTKQSRVLGGALEELDGVLDQVPGYAKARATWSSISDIDDALIAGRTALAGGPTTAQSPTDLIADFNAMKPDEKSAYIKGVREYIASIMGTSPNELGAIKRVIGKDWNKQKLAAIIGDDDAGRLFNAIDSEHTFTATRGVVSAGAKTNMAQEATGDLADIRAPDTLRRPGPLKRLKIGADEAGNAVIDALTSGRTTAANIDMGRILSAQGAERDKIVSALLRKAAAGKTTAAERLVIKSLEPLLFGGGMGAQLSGSER